MTSTTDTTITDGQQQPPQTQPTDLSAETPLSEKEATADQQEQTDGSNAETAETASPKKTATLKPICKKVDYEKDVVYLFQFTRCPTIPSASPFCLKVENWLRMNGITYENVDHKTKLRSKKGQLPFVELNGKEVADSDIIIRELSQYFDKDLDSGLTAEQKNISHAFIAMLNNHTIWVVRWWRYNNPGEFLEAAHLDIKRSLSSRLPNAVLNVLFKIGFKKSVKQAICHGLGRHTTEEIYDFGKGDLKALSEYLADKEYFFGKEPHLLDCVAFAHLAQFIYIPFAGMKEWMETETPNLVALVDRIKTRFWPDWEEIGTTLELNTHLPKKETTEEEAKKEEAKKEEERKKKEEKKKAQEDKKKEREEKKKKDKEEKERKKKEREEKERERKEKEKAEREEKEKAEKAEKEKAEAEKKADESNDKKADDKAEEKVNSVEATTEASETKDSKTNEDNTTPAVESADKKE